MKIDKEALIKYRKDMNWNQTEMSNFLGIGFRTYQTIESTGRVHKADHYEKISALFPAKEKPVKPDLFGSAKPPVADDWRQLNAQVRTLINHLIKVESVFYKRDAGACRREFLLDARLAFEELNDQSDSQASPGDTRTASEGFHGQTEGPNQ